jgi:putative membrane-bound dehydrogenase-like protein
MARRLSLMVLLVAMTPALRSDDGVLPTGRDGRPLNLDFETGDLRDWTTGGEAFAGQPVRGDTVAVRRRGASRHQGQFWVGGFERRGDRPTGTLTSAPFVVTRPWASFLIGGGPYQDTCVELLRADTNAVISRTSGLAEEDMLRVAVDLREHLGREIVVRLVDRQTGHWGHVNFDDFRLHADKPDLPARPAPRENLTSVGTPDSLPHAGLSPEAAAAAMTVPDGFRVNLFAGEPDVKQPIAFCIDDRGRLWVAEAYTYPVRAREGEGKDRILIFEDADGDGRFDKRTVFMEGLNLVSGLEVGFGGVWIGAAPYLMFVPYDPATDRPAGPPRILLDGWGYEDTHETLNTFVWGPDGWLYGCHGVFTHSRVGKPGTPAAERQPINAGIWRYHPVRHEFEVFAHGTSNPWGLDFNDRGQLFCEACVIPHNWHIIQGARYHRQAGSHFNPHTYADIQTIAEHRHYVGANPHAGNNRSDSAGGGHAHCGTMIYNGGLWPRQYQNQMFMGNIHGRRFNVDTLTAKGSGYVAGRAPDFLFANDAWARFINIQSGPDGNAYFIDWYDQQACHDNKTQIWDRTNGRIYKISYGPAARSNPVDLAKASDAELVEHQRSANDWFARHARRILHERQQIGPRSEAHRLLAAIVFGNGDVTHRLRAMWGMQLTGGISESDAVKLLADGEPYVRAWAVQLAMEGKAPSPSLLDRFNVMARTDPSPVVRLYLASAAQRLPVEARPTILEGLTAHPEDAADHNLPLMYWYAIEPLAGKDPRTALRLASDAKIPLLLPFMARRIASDGSPEALSLLTERLRSPGREKEILEGLKQGLAGRRQVPMPAGWTDVAGRLMGHQDVGVRETATALAVTFGDPAALAALRTTLAGNGPLEARLNALDALLGVRDPALPAVLHQLLGNEKLRGPALRGLASYDDPATPDKILAVYARLNPAERRDAVATLVARPRSAAALLDAVAANAIPAGDVSAEAVRQIRNLKNDALDQRVAELWGFVRVTPADRQNEIKRWTAIISSKTQPPADVHLGRTLYMKTCQQCHQLYGVGGKIGPDITGANRSDLKYLLENVIDPGAVIPKEYAMSVIQMADGRTISGIVRGETASAVTVQTATESLTLPVAEIEARRTSDLSMMPDDQLKPMSSHEVRSLFAYLQSPAQTPYLATPENAKEWFNGKDLTGWDGNPNLWRVENGEIVGTSPGLKRNEFLKSQLLAEDFRLTLQVRLTPDGENSGIQFRSEPLANGEMRGYQADIGRGWWGKLYEESGRGLLEKRGGEEHVRRDDWNEYVIEARGSRVRTWINGELCVDRDDPVAARRGIFGLQLHSGGPMEVRFRNLKLEVFPQP